MVMGGGRGDSGGGGGTVPMMPAMSPAGSMAGKKVDYGKFLSPVDPKTRGGNRRMIGGSGARVAPPSYQDATGGEKRDSRSGSVSRQGGQHQRTPTMPGIHSSPKNNFNSVHVRREVEW